MNNKCFAFLVSLSLGCAAFAQQGPGPADSDQPQRRVEVQPSWSMLDRFADMLVNRLELDEEQQVAFDEIVADYKQRMADDDTQATSRQELFQQLREAREAGDDERVSELREQLRGRFAEMRDTMNDLLDEVDPILHEDQREALVELRERFEQGRRQRNSREQLERAMRELPGELQLDAAQQEEFQAIVDDFRARGERMGEMRTLWREFRAAQESGDTARMEELRAQMSELRVDPRAMLDEFYSELGQILTDDQKARLAAYRERAGQPQPRPLDVRSVIRAAKRLDLTAEQADEVDRIESEAARALRELDRRDRDATVALAESVKERIAALLDDDQRQQFERLVTGGRTERPRMRGERRQRERTQPDEGDVP